MRIARRPMGALLGLVVLAACVDAESSGSAATQARAAPRSTAADTVFAQLVQRLSEPGGYFDTDNLISNETSYLHVNGELRELGLGGGAYIGVGPDQNFSYIAQLRPEIAYIIDIRRDNMLQHLLFKALFRLARNRVDYLCLLFGRPAPDDLATWDSARVEQLLVYIDETPPGQEVIERTRSAVDATVRSFGVPLSEDDLATIKWIHAAFINAGLDLRFSSHRRRPMPDYPTYRRLLLERDLTGREGNFLAREEDFRFVRALQERGRVVPVVGDFAGQHALTAIGDHIRELGLRVSAFYTSNVELYLMRGGDFDRFVENLERLPTDERSLIIRSYFGRGFTRRHPEAVPGYASTQLLQRVATLIDEHRGGGYQSYYDLVTRHLLAPR